MKSTVTTISDYLADMPPERQTAIEKVRNTILAYLPESYEETLNWGMITYWVPPDVYPDTNNKNPLMHAALANQKNHMAVYLIGIFMDENLNQEFESKYRETGKRYDAGKSCVRFRKLDDLPLQLIGESIATIVLDEFIVRTKGLSSHKTKMG